MGSETYSSPKSGDDRLVGHRPFSVSVRPNDSWTRAAVAGDLDMATATILEDALYPYRDLEALILFDLAEVTFVDVVGIKPIVTRCEKNLARIGSASPHVVRLLQLLSADKRADAWLVRALPA